MSFRILVLVLLIACGRNEPAAQTKSDESCLADEIGALRARPTYREACDTPSPECRKDCETGDMDACFYLAHGLDRSPSSEAEAHQLFERACRHGLAIACTNWAAASWVRKTSISDKCMRRVFEKSCDSGEPFGCGMVGRYEIELHETVASRARGFMRLARSCGELKGPPCHFLAKYIEDGTFGAADWRLIDNLMQRACDGGDDGACGEFDTVDETMARSAAMQAGPPEKKAPVKRRSSSAPATRELGSAE